METSAEACWRLSKACGHWAVESRDSAARIAFRQMATAWARLAFNEEFTTPLDERIDPPISGISETTPVKKLAALLTTQSSEDTQTETERGWTRHTRDCPCREASLRRCGTSWFRAKHYSGRFVQESAGNPPGPRPSRFCGRTRSEAP